VRGEVRREEDLGEDPLGLLHECGVLLRHAQRGVAQEGRQLVDEGEELLWREVCACEARADAVGGPPSARY